MSTITGMTYRPVPADFLTASYRIVGKVLVSNSGLLGILNDPSASFVEVHEAQIARLPNSARIIKRFETIRLVKTHLVAMCAGRRDDFGPQARARIGYARMAEYPVFIGTSVYEFDGIMELAGRFDFATLMAESILSFVPLYQVSIDAIHVPDMHLDSQNVLLNGRYIDVMTFSGQRTPSE